ncbi:hypothetical protein [Agrobacterium tumefaciens]|jgi:hypothetical protein|uniref:hypothetical protein n=1 Tax=Agrobacterium tumefaciens TaxID=358 RepID=UPI000ABEBEBD
MNLTIWQVPKGVSHTVVVNDLRLWGYDPIVGNDMLIYLDTAAAGVYAKLVLGLVQVLP